MGVLMKITLYILFLLIPFIGMATNYTYPTGNSNINVTNSTFGATLNAGDTVFIPPLNGGWRSFSATSLSSGVVGGYIIIYWQSALGAYLTPNSGGQLQANFLTSCAGVKIMNMNMSDNTDVLWRLQGYSSYIWLDSCIFRGMNGMGNIYVGSFANFAGDTTKMFHHWRISRTIFDSLYTTTTGSGVAIPIGANATSGVPAGNGFWRDIEIDHCLFDHYTSATGSSNYISAIITFNLKIHDCIFRNLSNGAPNPVGHASCINVGTDLFNIYNNVFGPYNFGNDARTKSADLPGYGGLYEGRSIFNNNISYDKRKYPVLESQVADTTNVGLYVRPRTSPICLNITAYGLAVGIGNSPYQACVVDCYNNDTVTLKNCIYTVLRDTFWTCNLNKLIDVATTPIGFYDTASNRMVQFFQNSGIADSVTYPPIKGGILYGTGVAYPAYITKDIYGTPVPQNGRVDIGAVELFFPYISIPVGSRIIIH
jgi:hypothetical protein